MDKFNIGHWQDDKNCLGAIIYVDKVKKKYLISIKSTNANNFKEIRRLLPNYYESHIQENWLGVELLADQIGPEINRLRSLSADGFNISAQGLIDFLSELV